MCGIAGLFAKTERIGEELGAHLERMLVQLNDRGPDSAGVAFYRNPVAPGESKLTLQHPDETYPWSALSREMAAALRTDLALPQRANHAVLRIGVEAAAAEAWVGEAHPEVRVMSAGTV